MSQSKICPTCTQLLSIESFGINRAKKDGRQTVCRSCRSERQKLWYEENKDRHRELVKISRDAHRDENVKKKFEYLKSHPCVDCGESNPVVLEFDHRDASQKHFTISKELRQKKWEDILTEIEKCDVRCANCHAIRTVEQFGYYAYISDTL